MHKIGILYHPLKERASAFAREIEGFLVPRGVSVWLCSAWDTARLMSEVNDSDLILTVGGDGTILRAAQGAVVSGAPITGINLGNLGFMTELGIDEALGALPAILEGKGWFDERSMLEVGLSFAGSTEPPRVFSALNDVVLARGNIIRTVNIEVSIDGERLTSYRSDGVIVATATGSTGYALAAGGPVLHPQSPEFVLVPVAPHLSTSYPFVLLPDSTVTLRIGSGSPAILSIDGHVNVPVDGAATVTAKHSNKKIRFLRVHPRTSFYRSLGQRLRGKVE